MSRFVAAFVFACLVASSATANASDDVRSASSSSCLAFNDLTAISFQPGQTTGRRRGPNVQTLTCVGNCPNHILLGAQCTRTGISDNGAPSWKCVGHFDGESESPALRLGLGQIRVQCEGCERAGDNRISANSCALQYSIRSMRHMSPRHGHGRHHHQDVIIRHHDAADGFFALMLFTFIFLSIALCVCWTRRSAARHETPYYPPHYGGGDAACHNGVPVAAGVPVAPGYHYHHSSPYYGGGGTGGFGTGMLMGYMMGGAGGYHHSSTTVNNYYDEGGYSGGDGGFGGGDDGGGFGGSDSV